MKEHKAMWHILEKKLRCTKRLVVEVTQELSLKQKSSPEVNEMTGIRHRHSRTMNDYAEGRLEIW